MAEFKSIGKSHIRVDNIKAESLEELLEERPNLRKDVLTLLAKELGLPDKKRKPRKKKSEEDSED